MIYRPDTELLSHYAAGLAAAAVRRLRLVRRDHGGHAARPRAPEGRRVPRDLSVRLVAAMLREVRYVLAKLDWMRAERIWPNGLR